MPDRCSTSSTTSLPTAPEQPDTLFGARSTARGLAHLAEQVVRCTPGCCGATATALTDGSVTQEPTAVTHPDLSALVAVQWEFQDGPIPAALDTGRPVGSDDLLHEERWPRYRAKALESGVRSSATLLYRRDDFTLTVTVYSFRPRPLEDAVRCSAALLGDMAATGMVRDRRYSDALAEVEQLDNALRTRPVVDQACGIVMYVLGCDADEAFRLLKHMSQRTNRKLSELARAVVRTRGHGIEAELERFRRKS